MNFLLLTVATSFCLIITLLLLAATGGEAQSYKYLILSSYQSSKCSPSTRLLYNLTIPLGTCLNNHDFDGPSCSVLTSCLLHQLPKMYGGFEFPYEALVNCSGAKSMHLSVKNTWDDSAKKIDSHIFPISKTCFGIPVPLHFKRGECASAFALSKKCGVAGSSVDVK